MAFIDYTSKEILVAAFEGFMNAVMNRIANLVLGDRKAIAAAIASIQKAAIHTKKFITDNGYTANTDLTDLWVDAFEKAVKANIDPRLEDFLLQKAHFWGQPKDWIGKEEKMILVPKLDFLIERCKEIQLMLK